jgi:hypothetical protein
MSRRRAPEKFRKATFTNLEGRKATFLNLGGGSHD